MDLGGTLVVRDCVSSVERAAQPAWGIVERLLDEIGSPREVIDRLASDATLSPEIRAAVGPAVLAESTRIGAEARRVVNKLAEEEPLVEDIVARLKSDGSLRRPVRDAALRMSNLRADDADTLAWRSWELARAPGREPDDYAKAIRWAETACKLEPSQESKHLSTVGVGQYRAGQYEAALATLVRADKLNLKSEGLAKKALRAGSALGGLLGDAPKRRPTDAAFIAMSLHRLGRADEARTWLRRLRSLVRAGENEGDEESLSFLREAEMVIEGRTTTQPNTATPVTNGSAP